MKAKGKRKRERERERECVTDIWEIKASRERLLSLSFFTCACIYHYWHECGNNKSRSGKFWRVPGDPDDPPDAIQITAVSSRSSCRGEPPSALVCRFISAASNNGKRFNLVCHTSAESNDTSRPRPITQSFPRASPYIRDIYSFRQLAERLSRCDFTDTFVGRVREANWRKSVRNCSATAVSARYRK